MGHGWAAFAMLPRWAFMMDEFYDAHDGSTRGKKKIIDGWDHGRGY